jgi:uncharacterized protein (TIGR01777 family)
VRVTITGGSGLIGRRLVRALRERGDEVTVLSRSPERAGPALGVEAVGWEALAGPAPSEALAGRDGVVHLLGENVAQRWTERARREIRRSREEGTRNLVAGLRSCDPRPPVLVASSAIGYYGSRGDELITEASPPGEGFLAGVCVAWEREAEAAAGLGMRVVRLRTGVVLDSGGGALARMLPPFRLGVGGPVAGGHQYVAWVHADDVVGLYMRALDDASWSGPYNAVAPSPVTNRVFSQALGRALGRPALAPVPAVAIRALYGDMAEIVTEGQRAMPRRALEGGYAFRHAELQPALEDALAQRP